MEIVELNTEEEYREAFPVMKELRTHLDEEQFLAITSEMAWDGYRLFAGRVEGRIVALAGVAVCLNLYHGRHVWVYELVTAEAERSCGYGGKLLTRMEELAREEECGMICLSSGVQRAAAHRFYEDRMGYTRAAYCYTKTVEG
jgi:GNAT superfamily N-acetyltransferase